MGLRLTDRIMFVYLIILDRLLAVVAAQAGRRPHISSHLARDSDVALQNSGLISSLRDDLDTDWQHLNSASIGQFHQGRRQLMRRNAEASFLEDEDYHDGKFEAPSGANKTEANSTIMPHVLVVAPYQVKIDQTVDNPLRMGFAVGCIGLAILSIIAAVLFQFHKPKSTEQMSLHENAAKKIQKQVRGYQTRVAMDRRSARRELLADIPLEHDTPCHRKSVVVADPDEINQRFLKLRPQLECQSMATERDYQTMVHTLSFMELSQVLNSRISDSDNYKCFSEAAGLRQEQAESYFNHHGPNKITPPERENIWIKLLKRIFGGLFNMLLWFCVVAQVILVKMKMDAHPDKAIRIDEFATPAILTIVIIAAAVLQWYTEMQAENMMESVQLMQSTQHVRVVRRDDKGNRVDIEIEPELLVPGDVIFLEAGLRVPADVRILHCTDGMEVDNSALTGESMPEPRVACVENDIPVMEARNVAFCGTTVLKGNATCMVHSTGDGTFLGRIASGLKSPRTLSTLEIQIEHFVHIVALVAIAVGLLSIAANMLSPVQRSIAEILQNSSTALFAQVPEGLLPTVTISLMIASQQLSQRNVLVRKLDAVETLGCVSVICSDKTGTLTTGEMSAVTLVVPKDTGASLQQKRHSQADAINPLRRLEPQQDIIRELSAASRADGIFDTESVTTQNFQSLCMCGVLNNGAIVSGIADVQGDMPIAPGSSREWTERWKATGSPTEVAILRASVECLGGLAGAMQLRGEFGLVHEVPFNSENKWMMTIHTHPQAASSDQQFQCILKGAPERVLNKCTLSKDERKQIDEKLQELMSRGLRVLCFATRAISDSASGLPSFKDLESSDTGSSGETNYPMDGFRFVGLVGIEDPPKAGVREAVLAARRAGVKVVMVTGDHPETAKAIASRIQILSPEQNGDDADFCCVPGTSLEGKMPQGESFSDVDPQDIHEWWAKAVIHTRVFARVSPIHKQVIVQAYQYFGNQKIGDIVAMTGDGVNDAPALKQADVGVAMGIRGTDVAKDAADIVLLDDNFSSIVAGMEQGRLASDNLQKSIMYTLCSKVPQVAPTFAEILGIPLAMNALQVLLIDIGTDIWTAIAYAVQPAEAALMRMRPRHPHFEKLVNWRVLLYSYCYIGQLQMLLCWAFYFMTPGITRLIRKEHFSAEEKLTHSRGMTVYYWTLMLGQIAAAISTTTKSQQVFGIGSYGFPNNLLNLLLVLEIALGLAVIFVKTLNTTFGTAPLSAQEVVLPLLALPCICIIDEIRKATMRSRRPLVEDD